MNKTILIFIATLLISLIFLIGFVGSIIYSVSAISYNLTGSEVTPHITKKLIPPSYLGYLEVKVNVDLNNNGFYDISDLKVDINVYAYNWSISSILNGDQVASGSNTIGSISAGKSWTGAIAVNVTKDIPHFAVENCDLKIDIAIHLVYHPIISIPFDYQTTTYQHYTAPF